MAGHVSRPVTPVYNHVPDRTPGGPGGTPGTSDRAGRAETRCRTMSAIKFETIDHVSLPVAVGEAGKEADPLKKSKAFYGGILGLREIGRPTELAKSIKLGAWYQVGASGSTLHLIANEDGQSTFRRDKKLSSRDIHIALRISNFVETLRYLIS